jgi:hypothetical protein
MRVQSGRQEKILEVMTPEEFQAAILDAIHSSHTLTDAEYKAQLDVEMARRAELEARLEEIRKV